MKSDKLQDAIGMVDGDLIERARKSPKSKTKKHRIKWAAPIAATLAVIIGLGVFFSAKNINNNPTILSAYAVVEAQYPETVAYPEGELLPDFKERYEAWKEYRNNQREYSGAGENLDGFLQATASEFLKDSENKNLVYSPLNVYMALSMLAETSEGNTRQQILDLLDAEDMDSLRAQAHAVWNANYSDDGAVTSILASSLWLNEDIEFNKSTVGTLAENYYASVFQAEMGSENMDKALQSWLNQQTGGLLSDYVSNIELDPRTLMTLATTIYFQAKWDIEFSEKNNTTGVFHSPDRNVYCKFMNQTENYGTYYWGDKFGATKKRLQGSGNMYFILPDEGVTPQDLLRDKEALAFITQSEEWEQKKELKVNLSLPKFDVKSNLDLTQGLKNLGVTDCFDFSSADFTPLLSNEQTAAISGVDHGARVVIDEEGVTATAYTELKLYGAGLPPENKIDFVLDRPFIFVITGYDGLPLFIGVVNQP